MDTHAGLDSICLNKVKVIFQNLCLNQVTDIVLFFWKLEHFGNICHSLTKTTKQVIFPKIIKFCKMACVSF